MSNLSNANSRFASLMDDVPVNNKAVKNEKTVSTQQKTINTFNTFKSKPEDHDDKKNSNNKQISVPKKDILNMDDFPCLIVHNKTDENKIINLKYLEKLEKNNEEEEKEIDADLVNLKPGWTLIRKDVTGEIIMKSHPKVEQNYNQKCSSDNHEKTENEIATDIINSLVELHQKRTQEYIELNGYDIWEKKFKFPNWQEEEELLYDSDEDEEEVDDIGDESYYDEYYDEC